MSLRLLNQSQESKRCANSTCEPTTRFIFSAEPNCLFGVIYHRPWTRRIRFVYFILVCRFMIICSRENFPFYPQSQPFGRHKFRFHICCRLTQAENLQGIAQTHASASKLTKSCRYCWKVFAASDRDIWVKCRELYDRMVPQAPKGDHWPKMSEELPLKLKREPVRQRNKKYPFTECDGAEISFADWVLLWLSPYSKAFMQNHAEEIYPMFTHTIPESSHILPFMQSCAVHFTQQKQFFCHIWLHWFEFRIRFRGMSVAETAPS